VKRLILATALCLAAAASAQTEAWRVNHPDPGPPDPSIEAVLALAREAMGGAAVTSLDALGSEALRGRDGVTAVCTVVALRDGRTSRSTQRTDGSFAWTWWDGVAVHALSDRAPAPAPGGPAELAQLQGQAFHALALWPESRWRPVASREVELGGVGCQEVVCEDPAGAEAVLVYDCGTRLPLGIRLEDAAGGGRIEVSFSDWRAVGALTLFHRAVVRHGGDITVFDYRRLDAAPAVPARLTPTRAVPVPEVPLTDSHTIVRIYSGPVFLTDDPEIPEAAAVAVDAAGRVVEFYGEVPRDTPWEHDVLPGALALPGLHDAHLHVSGIGKRCEQAALESAASAAEAAALAQAWAVANPDAAVIRGRGWDQSRWPDGTFPHWRDLEALGDRPAVLRRVDGHASWVNRALLAAAGIDRDTPDPAGGRILRDEDGEPTGVLIDNAADLLTPVLPEPSTADRERWLLAGLDACADVGLVAVHDMGQTPETCDVAQRLADEGRLPIRLFVYLEGSDPESMVALGRYHATGRFVVQGMKYYTDGALGSRGALLLEDYSDEPGRRGLAVTAADSLARLVAEVHRRGFQCAIHAIGDGGNRMALDAIAFAQQGTTGRRHRVEHAQVVHPDDFVRFVQLDAVPSMQPTHCTSDLRWAEARLGSDRVLGAYAWRTFLDLGLHLPFGSDAPVEDWNPLPGIYAAVTRQDAAGSPAGGWYPAQALTWREALACFSSDAAWAVGREADLGRLRIGMQCDLTVLDRDPRDRDPVVWLATGASALVVGGERVR
jgi:hypothetical protein